MPTDPEVSISRVLPGESATLYRLLQLYYYESSRCSREDVQNNGLYESDEAGVAQYTNNASGDEAYFVRANGNLAGFALVDRYQGDDGPVQELADLFILPKYRGQGLATGLIEHTVLGNEQKWLLAVFGPTRTPCPSGKGRLRNFPSSRCEQSTTTPSFTCMS